MKWKDHPVLVWLKLRTGTRKPPSWALFLGVIGDEAADSRPGDARCTVTIESLGLTFTVLQDRITGPPEPMPDGQIPENFLEELLTTGPPGHDEIGANVHLQVIPESILETSDDWDGRWVGQNGEALGVKLVSRFVRQPDLVLVPHAWRRPEKSERTFTTRSAEEDLGLDLHLIPPRPSTPQDAGPTPVEDPLDPDVVWQIYREALRSGQNDEEPRCSTTAALGEEAAEVFASTYVSRNPDETPAQPTLGPSRNPPQLPTGQPTMPPYGGNPLHYVAQQAVAPAPSGRLLPLGSGQLQLKHAAGERRTLQSARPGQPPR